MFPTAMHPVMVPAWPSGPFTERPARSHGYADVRELQVAFDALDDVWQGHRLAQGAQASHSSVGKKRLKKKSNLLSENWLHMLALLSTL